MPSCLSWDMFNHIQKWRDGGHRGPLSASQKKAKEKSRKKRKGKR